MRVLPFVLAVASFVLALVILVLTEPPRAVFSGAFFVVIGVALLVNPWRRRREAHHGPAT